MHVRNEEYYEQIFGGEHLYITDQNTGRFICQGWKIGPQPTANCIICHKRTAPYTAATDSAAETSISGQQPVQGADSGTPAGGAAIATNRTGFVNWRIP